MHDDNTDFLLHFLNERSNEEKSLPQLCRFFEDEFFTEFKSKSCSSFFPDIISIVFEQVTAVEPTPIIKIWIIDEDADLVMCYGQNNIIAIENFKNHNVMVKIQLFSSWKKNLNILKFEGNVRLREVMDSNKVTWSIPLNYVLGYNMKNSTCAFRKDSTLCNAANWLNLNFFVSFSNKINLSHKERDRMCGDCFLRPKQLALSWNIKNEMVYIEFFSLGCEKEKIQSSISIPLNKRLYYFQEYLCLPLNVEEPVVAVVKSARSGLSLCAAVFDLKEIRPFKFLNVKKALKYVNGVCDLKIFIKDEIYNISHREIDQQSSFSSISIISDLDYYFQKERNSSLNLSFLSESSICDRSVLSNESFLMVDICLAPPITAECIGDYFAQFPSDYLYKHLIYLCKKTIRPKIISDSAISNIIKWIDSTSQSINWCIFQKIYGSKYIAKAYLFFCSKGVQKSKVILGKMHNEVGINSIANFLFDHVITKDSFHQLENVFIQMFSLEEPPSLLYFFYKNIPEKLLSEIATKKLLANPLQFERFLSHFVEITDLTLHDAASVNALSILNRWTVQNISDLLRMILLPKSKLLLFLKQKQKFRQSAWFIIRERLSEEYFDAFVMLCKQPEFYTEAKELGENLLKSPLSYETLAIIHQKMGILYEFIAKKTINELHCTFFKVSFQGVGWPFALRDKAFIIEQNNEKKLSEFTDQLQKMFIHASIIPSSCAVASSDWQSIQTVMVTPTACILKGILLNTPKFSDNVDAYFAYSFPEKRYLIKTADLFPNGRNASRIVHEEFSKVSEIENAISCLKKRNQLLLSYINKKTLSMNETKQLHLIVFGSENSNVNGGIETYKKEFLVCPAQTASCNDETKVKKLDFLTKEHEDLVKTIRKNAKF